MTLMISEWTLINHLEENFATLFAYFPVIIIKFKFMYNKCTNMNIKCFLPYPSSKREQ